jgi:hypothetical protein
MKKLKSEVIPSIAILKMDSISISAASLGLNKIEGRVNGLF